MALNVRVHALVLPDASPIQLAYRGLVFLALRPARESQALHCTRGCVFHAIVGTDSTGWWARIPREGGHGFHAIVGASQLRG